ncbi:glycosyl transferase [Obelidium mucronatum]|nr:glycosyl transferase [Obelidium mucronatum]
MDWTPHALLAGVLLRWLVSLWPHSGAATPPLFGDFEAQRHWLELTTHLPAAQWYAYDVLYWGLDYPPLTAYHSWLLGRAALAINPDWVALDASRGLESPDLKLFMRYTALITDVVINMTAIGAFARFCCKNRTRAEQTLLLFLALIQPALILIDHGHFQYNSAMLGFSLWTVICLSQKRYVLGSIFFCLALGFKQMALYYSLPVFFYLLGVSFGIAKREGAVAGFIKLAQIGATVILTFGLLFAPFLSSTSNLLQVIHRIFPVDRGLYEDKVANFWCAISVLVKVKKLFPVETLVRFSIIATLIGVLPTSINLFLAQRNSGDTTPRRLLLGLLTGSLAFFLFSFQVHEKSILIPLMPATMLLLDNAWEGSFFITTAMFSMYPLLRRDGLVIPTLALTLLFNLLFGWGAIFGSQAKAGLFVKIFVFGCYLFMGCLIFGEELVNAVPIPRYPDLYVVVNSFVSCNIFILLYLRYSFVQLFEELEVTPTSAKKKVE